MSTALSFSDWIRKINQRIASSLEEIRKQDNNNTTTNRSDGSLPESGKSDESTLAGGNSSNVDGKLDEKSASSLEDIKVEEKKEGIWNIDTLGIISFFITNSMIAWKLRQIIEEERENLQEAEPVSADLLNNQTITQSGLTANLKNVKAYNVHSFEFRELAVDKNEGVINYLVTAPYVSLKLDAEISGTMIGDWRGGAIDIKFVEPSLKGLLRFQLDPIPQMIKAGMELDYDFQSIEVTGTSLEVGAVLSRELDRYLRENEKDILGKATKRFSDNADEATHAAD